MVKRCTWVNLKNELYIRYHDEEWGKLETDDRVLFEFLILEGAQAGLSWETVLNKRENFREAFDGFDPEKIALYDQQKVLELLQNTGIIRNKLKINSAIKNAKVYIEIQNEFGSFYNFIASFFDTVPKVINQMAMVEVRTTSIESDAISKELKRRGMSFVGSNIMYAYLQAIGFVNDHEQGCDFNIHNH